MNPGLVWALWFVQEWAWNVYPSTDTSSAVVVFVQAVTVVASWWGAYGTSPMAKREEDLKKRR